MVARGPSTPHGLLRDAPRTALSLLDMIEPQASTSLSRNSAGGRERKVALRWSLTLLVDHWSYSPPPVVHPEPEKLKGRLERRLLGCTHGHVEVVQEHDELPAPDRTKLVFGALLHHLFDGRLENTMRGDASQACGRFLHQVERMRSLSA